MTDNILEKANPKGGEMTLSNYSKKIILAFQHLIAMFGATVLVPILTGFDPSIALFSAGIGTLIFHLSTRGKVPVFLGSSFAFIPVILTVNEMYNGDLAYAQGGMVAAGLIYVLISFLIKKIGMERIERYLAPQVVGPMIIVIGLNLIPTAFDMSSESYGIAAITLATALIISYRGRGFVRQLSILIAVLVGYLIASLYGMVSIAPIVEAQIIAVPAFRLPKFDIGAIAIIAPVVLAVFMEHLGDITTNGQVVGKNFIEDPGLNRTLLGDGLATTFAALIGGPANTTYGENTGVLAITKNYDPSILRLAAVFAVLLGFIGKIGAILSTIPTAVMGGISIMLFSMISIIGVKTIKSQAVKFNWKNIIVMGSILTLGLGGEFLSAKLGFTIGIPINESVQITGLSFAALVGIIINRILNK
ncbi:MAG: uracil-xanthine permease family protein [Tissierellaceae bacterium]